MTCWALSYIISIHNDFRKEFTKPRKRALNTFNSWNFYICLTEHLYRFQRQHINHWETLELSTALTLKSIRNLWKKNLVLVLEHLHIIKKYVLEICYMLTLLFLVWRGWRTGRHTERIVTWMFYRGAFGQKWLPSAGYDKSKVIKWFPGRWYWRHTMSMNINYYKTKMRNTPRILDFREWLWCMIYANNVTG